MKKIIIISLAILTLTTGFAERVNQTGYEGKTYVYKESNGVPMEIEVYFPKGRQDSEKAVPGLIMFHGGGWGNGTRDMFRYVCNYFAERGLVTATVTYRLATKEEKATMKGEVSYKRFCITDAKSAIRWYKQHAGELGVDPEKIIAGGGSAGGHISLLATTNPGLNDPSDPKGYDTSVAAYLLFNPALREDDAKDPEVDFLQHLSADLPPAIAFFGSEDGWLKGWDPAYRKLRSLGNSSLEYWIAPGEKHAFFNSQPWADITLIASDRFLEKLGFIKGKPTLANPASGEKLVPAKVLSP